LTTGSDAPKVTSAEFGWDHDGVVGEPAGVLEDHADVAEGLLALHQATAEPRWLDAMQV